VLDIQHLMRSRLLAIRALERILTSDTFKNVFEATTEEQRDIVKQHINNGDKIAIEKWIAMQEKSPEQMNVVQLRQLASKLGIANYNLLPKASLLSAIRNKNANH
jgi:Rho termination factor, N-terminal domain